MDQQHGELLLRIKRLEGERADQEQHISELEGQLENAHNLTTGDEAASILNIVQSWRLWPINKLSVTDIDRIESTLGEMSSKLMEIRKQKTSSAVKEAEKLRKE